MSDFTLTEAQLGELAPPIGLSFRLGRPKTICIPHPYCITPKHVHVAAEYFTGVLSKEAIIRAEQLGAVCGTCRENSKRGIDQGVLSYKAHETMNALQVVLPNDHPKNLKEIPGLEQWLLSINAKAESWGVQGFVFPKESQYKG